jgi:hypothetical protein
MDSFVSIPILTPSPSEYLLDSLDENDWASSADDAEKKKRDQTHRNEDDTASKFTVSDKGSVRVPREKKVNVLMKLLGPLANTRIRSIKRTVWFWGILLGGRSTDLSCPDQT